MAAMVMGEEIHLWLGRYVHVGDHTLTVRGVAGDLTQTAELVVRVFQSRPVAAAGPTRLAIAGTAASGPGVGTISGQLGLGNTTDRNSPVRVGADTDWVAVAGGNSHSVALKVGRLALGRGRQRLRPARDRRQPSTRRSSAWATTATGSPSRAGDDFTLAIKADRSLWAWGRNRFGQLGTGNTAGQDAPVRVAGEAGSRWRAARTTPSRSSADGSLWTWGDDTYGQLGNGDATGHVTRRSGRHGERLAPRLRRDRRRRHRRHQDRRHPVGLGPQHQRRARPGRGHRGDEPAAGRPREWTGSTSRPAAGSPSRSMPTATSGRPAPIHAAGSAPTSPANTTATSSSRRSAAAGSSCPPAKDTRWRSGRTACSTPGARTSFGKLGFGTADIQGNGPVGGFTRALAVTGPACPEAPAPAPPDHHSS